MATQKSEYTKKYQTKFKKSLYQRLSRRLIGVTVNTVNFKLKRQRSSDGFDGVSYNVFLSRILCSYSLAKETL